MDCMKTCTVCTLTLSCELADGRIVTVWAVRNLRVYVYLPAKARLPAGTQRLIFTLAGERTAAGIDDVTLSDDYFSFSGE